MRIGANFSLLPLGTILQLLFLSYTISKIYKSRVYLNGVGQWCLDISILKSPGKSLNKLYFTLSTLCLLLIIIESLENKKSSAWPWNDCRVWKELRGERKSKKGEKNIRGMERERKEALGEGMGRKRGRRPNNDVVTRRKGFIICSFTLFLSHLMYFHNEEVKKFILFIKLI